MADVSTKKRKRAEDGQSRPQKKKTVVEVQAAGGLPGTLKITSVLKPQFSPPVLATAPGLTLLDDIKFNSYAKGQPSPPKKRKDGSTSAAKELMLHSSSHRTLDYTAREDRAGGPAEAPLQNYIGVFDPRTGKLQVVEARKMVVRGAVRAQQATAEEMGERGERHNLLALRNELGQTFGTKKAKKAIAAITENAIAPAGSSPSKKLGAGERALMQTIQHSTAGMATAEQLQSAVDLAKPVPPGNFDAEDVQDVYSAAQIIGADVLAAIPVRDWQEAARKDEGVSLTSQYVASRFARAAAAAAAVDGGAEGLQRLRVLRYIFLLLTLWQGCRPGKARGATRMPRREQLAEALAPAPAVVVDALVRRFSDAGNMAKRHRDLLMTTCCALACLVDNFDVNTFHLREDLKLEQKEMSQYFAEIGARTRKVKVDGREQVFAKLMLPLQFPKMRMARGR